MKDIDLKVFREAWLDLVKSINDQEIELQQIEFHRVGCHPVQYGSYYCEVCKNRWTGIRGSHVCEPTPEQKEEAYLRWAREFKPEWLPAAMAEADAEQKEQSDACIKHYLDGLHHALFDALTQTRNEQSKDIQAKRVIDILLAQRMGK